MNETEPSKKTRTMRFSIVQLLLLTLAAAVFCVVLMNENVWLRAALMTSVAGITLNALIAMILARGEQQAFSIGFVVGAAFFYLCASAYEFMLPYLITVKFHELINAWGGNISDDEHFYLVTGTFWFLLTTFSSGLIGRRWYCRVHPPAQSQT